MHPAEHMLNARHVAIIMLSAIGDAVHVLPIINALKAHNSQLEITWVIQPVAHLLVKNHPSVDHFILFQRRSGLGMARELWKSIRQIRKTPFDLVIGLQVYLKAGILLAGTKADVKLGFDRVRARDLQWLFSSHQIPPHEPQHVLDQYFEFLEYLNVPYGEPVWKLGPTEEEQIAQKEFFDKIGRPVCAVVVGTSKREKEWSVEKYATLLEVLESDYDFQTVLVGGPSQPEQQRAAEVIARTRAQPKNELGNDLRRLMYLLHGSALVVSPDTGPLHITRALDVPVVGLYGYTNPRRAGPYRKFMDLVVDGYAIRPGEEYAISAEYRPDGMKRITLEMVVEKVDLAVKTYVQK